jgi:hypothetical protein
MGTLSSHTYSATSAHAHTLPSLWHFNTHSYVDTEPAYVQRHSQTPKVKVPYHTNSTLPGAVVQ